MIPGNPYPSIKKENGKNERDGINTYMALKIR